MSITSIMRTEKDEKYVVCNELGYVFGMYGQL